MGSTCLLLPGLDHSVFWFSALGVGSYFGEWFVFFLQKPKSCSSVGGESGPLGCWGQQGWDQNCCSGSSGLPDRNGLPVGFF